MESVIVPCSSSSSSSSSSPTFPIFFPRRPASIPSRPLHFSLSVSRGDENEADPESESKDLTISVPILSNNRQLSLSPLSKDTAMGLALSAATGRGWTTGSGMEGPSVPDMSDGKSSTGNVSTFPWSLFTKSPRRRMLVAFTCNICGQRTTRAINPHAYTDGTVFVQCCGCSAFHKLVDNLNLFHEMSCYVSPSFSYKGNGWKDMNFKYLEIDDNDDVFPID